MAAAIVYSPEAVDHLAALSKADQVRVVDQVERLLADQPTLASRKRKFLRPNSLAQRELRLGDLRVFYDVTTDPASDSETTQARTTVSIKGVGKKVHNELWIGGEKIEL
ncbi:MAG: type II toxin-antitoxin system RelE/ParE family toxin [Planctomycetes bacterium]|nr:type II toxin-antitoxin system RelE/ParE family toxin [Planctomycetota bacterium]